MQVLNSDHVRERDKALLRGILAGCVWNGFLLGKVMGQRVPCRFCGGADSDGHLFGKCTFPPLVEIREHLTFMSSWRWISRLRLGVYFCKVGYLFFLG